MKKKFWILIVILLFIILALIGYYFINNNLLEKNSNSKIDISNLKVEGESLKVYELDDYESFLEDYKNDTLPEVYVTKFLYDGAGMYKTYDLDDFIEEGNDLDVDVLESTVININSIGDYELSGELIGGMVAVNTNDLKGNINISLNGVKIDTDSKKIPAIYVYNKDITYSECKVTIKALKDSDNYIEGGKLKKISLLPSDDLDSYSSKYTGEMSNNYETYVNYYGVYTNAEIENILFASVTADKEDLADGDPYYYYKGSGAISSDIDLYFEGEGRLEVVSKGKEGIETKGSLSFVGGIGDYVINGEDDCLNTTTDSSENKNAHNDLYINVHSLTAIVSSDADEGDAIDSNGKLTIDGGMVIAIAKNGQDAGLDSESGTIINGGTVLATGDMYDQISSDSKQKFLVLSFGERISKDTLITLLNESDEVVFSYLTDREYSNLIFSSATLDDGNYALYKDGSIDGDSYYGLYLSGSYSKGVQLGYSAQGQANRGSFGHNPRNGEEPPEKPEGEVGDMQDIPNGERPERPMDSDKDKKMFDRENNANNGFDNGQMIAKDNMTMDATNKDFVINGISNLFSGVATLKSE